MYQRCPKCGFKNSPDTKDKVCPQCGLIFDKWLKNKYKSKSTSARKSEPKPKHVSTLIQSFKHHILYIPEDFSKPRFYLNLSIYVLFYKEVAMHNVPLVIGQVTSRHKSASNICVNFQMLKIHAMLLMKASNFETCVII